jgi:hypothetical protein
MGKYAILFVNGRNYGRLLAEIVPETREVCPPTIFSYK